MEFLDLVNISEAYMELINPSSLEKVATLGRFLRMTEGSRVIDYGCGFGTALVMWAEQFGISGVGIDIRPYACERARHKVWEAGLSEQIEIVCGAGADYRLGERQFDVATCIGASFIWGGYRPALQALKASITSKGRVGIGEPYWNRSDVPEEIRQKESSLHFESELLAIAREEGFEVEYVQRASVEDWDRYEADNWHGLIRWLEENPTHPNYAEVYTHLRKTQTDYFEFGREHFGWAMYVLTPSL
jgi:SAM-dependent methyltransferase